MPCALFIKWLKLGLNARSTKPKNASTKQLPRQTTPGRASKIRTNLFIYRQNQRFLKLILPIFPDLLFSFLSIF
jgi:hypothetical protein